MNINGEPEYKLYMVTMSFQFPAHDEREGIPYEVEAKSKSAANKEAKRQAERDGHIVSGKGRITFKAREL